MSLYQYFFNQYHTIIKSLFPLYNETNNNKFDYNFDSSRINFGDISTNHALKIAKIYKTNPMQIAEKIKEHLQAIEHVEKIDIMQPGFINIFFDDQYYRDYLKNLYQNKNYFTTTISDKNIYNIEFVSANPTGPLHIGHGRGAIIGDSFYKILKLKGYSAQAEYYINDAGNQILKLGKSLYLRYQEKCNIKNIIFDDDLYQGHYIINLAETIYQNFGKTKLHTSINWFSQYAKDYLLSEIKTTLSEYQITFDTWFSEKTLHKDAIDRSIALLEKKGYVYTTPEDQTVWFRATDFGDEKDRVLKKKDGLWTYTAADIAYLMNKIERGFTKIIMVLGQDHHSFKIRMHAIAQAIGFPKENLVILLYQLVTLKHENEIVRMSKRKGNSIDLQDIIDNVGSDVARFFYLHRKQEAHLDFDIRQALEKDKSNPVFYIQYALVRISSVLKKYTGLASEKQILESISEYHYGLTERLILKKINFFDIILNEIISEYNTHLLAFYTLELAGLFHSFYMHNTIISNNPHETQSRIALVKTIRDVLSCCAKTLGISIPEHM